jgi:hypothetical protein
MAIQDCSIIVSTTTSSEDCPFGAYTPYVNGENVVIQRVKTI